MFEKFRNLYSFDTEPDDDDERQPFGSFAALQGDLGLANFMHKFSGNSFNRGLYRVLNSAELRTCANRVNAIFPEYEGRICPIAFDWLNRVYCADFERTENANPLLLLFSHFADEVLQIPACIQDFHDEILTATGDQVLEAGLFNSFLDDQHRTSLSRNECAAMVVPLFMGGPFRIENMTVGDVQLDWDFTSQLLTESRSLPAGTPISNVLLQRTDIEK